MTFIRHSLAALFFSVQAAAHSAPADTPADLRNCAPPAFLRTPQQSGSNGKITLRVRIDRQGRVVDAKLDKSSGDAARDAEALAAARRCSGTPAMKAGQPVAASATISHAWRVD
jgi:protein TonB